MNTTSYIDALEKCKNYILNTLGINSFTDMYLHIGAPDNISFTQHKSKPENIPDEIWNVCEVKDMFIDWEMIEDEGPFMHCWYIAIHNYCFLFNQQCFYLVSPEWNKCEKLCGTIDVKEHFDREIKFFTESISMYDTDHIQHMISTCIEFYGEENVEHLDAFQSRGNNDYRKSHSIVIRHGSFWIEDTFGIKYLLKDPYTFIIFQGLCPQFEFFDTKPDYCAAKIYGYNHSHVPHMCGSIQENRRIKPSSVCTGSNTPINQSLNSYFDIPSKDNAFDLILNYENLIQHESEKGGPHVRMRKVFFETIQSRVDSLDSSELMAAIKNKEINIHVSIDPIEVTISIASIHQYLKEKYNDNESNETIYYSEKDHRAFKCDHSRLNSYWDSHHVQFHYIASSSFFFKGEEVIIKPIEYDPTRYDFSGVKENPNWSKSSVAPPSSSTIDDCSYRLEAILNQYIYNKQQENNIITFDYDESKSELVGLTKIKRNTTSDVFSTL